MIVQRRLVVEIPHVTCIGCKLTAPGALHHIYTDGTGGLNADIKPPAGWTRLIAADRVPDGQPNREFAVCPSCYQAGAAWGARCVPAAFEVLP